MAAWQGGCSFDRISVVNDALWYVLELLERMMNAYVLMYVCSREVLSKTRDFVTWCSMRGTLEDDCHFVFT